MWVTLMEGLENLYLQLIFPVVLRGFYTVGEGPAAANILAIWQIGRSYLLGLDSDQTGPVEAFSSRSRVII